MKNVCRFAVLSFSLGLSSLVEANPGLQWPAQHGAPSQYGAPAYSYPPVQTYPPAVVIVPQQAGPAYPEPRFRSPYNDVDRPWVMQQQEREYQWRLQQEQRMRSQPGNQSAWGRR